MERDNDEKVYHSVLRGYVKTYCAFIPCFIIDEIRLELNLDLLMYVKYAIEHLRTHLRDPKVGGRRTIAELAAHPAYCVQKAAVDLALFREFAKTQYPLLNAPVFSQSTKYARVKLAYEKELYDNEHGEGASGLLLLFGDDD